MSCVCSPHFSLLAPIGNQFRIIEEHWETLQLCAHTPTVCTLYTRLFLFLIRALPAKRARDVRVCAFASRENKHNRLFLSLSQSGKVPSKPTLILLSKCNNLKEKKRRTTTRRKEEEKKKRLYRTHTTTHTRRCDEKVCSVVVVTYDDSGSRRQRPAGFFRIYYNKYDGTKEKPSLFPSPCPLLYQSPARVNRKSSKRI